MRSKWWTRIIIVFSILTWLVVGAAGSIYYWTKNFPLTTRNCAGVLPGSIAGPFVWMLSIELPDDPGRVLIEAREPWGE